MKWERTTVKAANSWQRDETTYASGVYKIVKQYSGWSLHREDVAVHFDKLADAKLGTDKVDAKWLAMAPKRLEKKLAKAAETLKACRLNDSKRFVPGVHQSQFHFFEKLVGCTAEDVRKASIEDAGIKLIDSFADEVDAREAAPAIVERLNYWYGSQFEPVTEVIASSAYYTGRVVILLRQHQQADVVTLSATVMLGAETWEVDNLSVYCQEYGTELTPEAASVALFHAANGRHANELLEAAEMVDDRKLVIRDGFQGAIVLDESGGNAPPLPALPIVVYLEGGCFNGSFAPVPTMVTIVDLDEENGPELPEGMIESTVEQACVA